MYFFQWFPRPQVNIFPWQSVWLIEKTSHVSYLLSLESSEATKPKKLENRQRGCKFLKLLSEEQSINFNLQVLEIVTLKRYSSLSKFTSFPFEAFASDNLRLINRLARFTQPIKLILLCSRFQRFDGNFENARDL